MGKQIALVVFGLSVLAVSGCVSREQIAENKARYELTKDGKELSLSGCDAEGANCFEQAKAACANVGQVYHWMYSTKGQTAAGKGERTVKCVPSQKVKS